MLGLGLAATPAGLTGFKELEREEEERRISDHEYLLPAADSGGHHRLPEPIWECGSRGDYMARDCGHGDGVL